MELYIDLTKGSINTSRLVKRPIQVRGKNGKVFTRMQWVDPVTGLPASKSSHVESEQPKKTKKEHIDEHVKNMSREEKYHHISKHNLEWKRNEHPSIDHKNAVMAIKDHLHKNPHLAGAEHLDDHENGTKDLEGTDSVNSWADKYTKDRDKLYKMMHHAGVIDDATDPRDVDAWKSKAEGGNGSAPIRHMKNLMSFKKYMKENPHKMDEFDNHPDFGIKGEVSKTKKTEDKPDKGKSKAEQGGNTIGGILKNMPATELYELAKRLGLADRDPRTNPEWASKKDGGNGTAPIRHMKVMVALKKAVEQDPSILNLGENGKLAEHEEKRLNDRNEDETLNDKVKEFLDGVSKEVKLKWADEHKDHEHMKNRIKSAHENVDNMHKTASLKKIILDNPSLMEKGSMKDEHDKEQLRNLKIGNKMMQKILLNVVGLKGIGDVKSEERNVEWSFGVDSFARINEEDDGSLVLSVVDAGKDGDEYNEHQFPLEQVKKYIDDFNSGKSATMTAKEIPLHKKPTSDIWKALNNDFDSNYTPEVGDVLKKNISESWLASGRSADILEVSKKSEGTPTGIRKVLENLGVGFSGRGLNIIDTESNAFKHVAYDHMIDKEKNKNANDYIQRWKHPVWGHDMADTWLLHESAKHWQPEERSKARKEVIRTSLNVGDVDPTSKDDRMVKLTDHTHKTLEFVPFDMLTDMLAQGYKTDVSGKDKDGKKIEGAYFSPSTKTIHLDHEYYTNHSLMNATHPVDHVPSRKHSFMEVMSHEFAHAVDYHLSGDSGYLNWGKHKYAGSNPKAVTDSYAQAVNGSNPDKLLGIAKNGNDPYVYHKDEWMSAYEGRVYHPDYYNKNTNRALMTPTGNGKEAKDNGWDSHTSYRGLEHWSENSARYSGAFQMYKKWQKKTGDSGLTNMSEWAKMMHDKFIKKGYADEGVMDKLPGGNMLKTYRQSGSEGIQSHPELAYGYLYHRLSTAHPTLAKSLHEVYGRGDFVDQKSPSMKEQYESGDFTRKSELVIYL